MMSKNRMDDPAMFMMFFWQMIVLVSIVFALLGERAVILLKYIL